MMLLFVAAGLVYQFQFRPQLFTFVMLSFLVAKLAKEVYSGPVRLWNLVPMFILWANFHAGCFTGLAALAIFTAAVGVQELISRRRLVRSSELGAVTLVCALVTLLNPLGAGLWKTFMVSLTDPLIRPIISDWQPLPHFLVYAWHSSIYEPILYTIPLLLFAALPVSFVAAPVLDDAPLVAVALVFTAAAFYSVRNVALVLIVLCIPVAYHIGIAIRERNTRAAGSEPGDVKPSPLVVIAAAALIAVLAGEFSNRLKTWEPLPERCVAFMQTHGLRGNMLNNFDWGGYLIWHLCPQSKVFIDSRFELVYPDRLLKQYFAVFYGQSSGRDLLDGYPHDFALLKPGTGAYRTIAKDSAWRLIYHDHVASLFAKARAAIPEATGGNHDSIAKPTWFP
jgi:hypothetical protein